MRCFCAIATLVCLLWSGQILRAQTTADSLHSVLRQHGERDTVRVRLLVDYAWEIRDGDLDDRIRVLNEALQLSRQLNFEKGIGDAEMQLGNCYQKKGDYPAAERSFVRGILIRQKLGDIHGVARGYNNLGGVIRLMGRHLEAERHLQTALKQFQVLKDTVEIAKEYMQLCRLWRTIGDYKKSLTYGYSSLFLKQALRNPSNADIGNSYETIGTVYLHMGENFRARQAYDSAMMYLQQTDNARDQAITLSNLALVAEYENHFDTALSMSRQSYHQFMVLHDSVSAARILRNMARIYTALGNFGRARIALGDALEILKDTDKLPLRLMVFADLAELDIWEGRPKSAIEALEALIPRLDTVAEVAQRIHLLQMSSIALAADQRFKESYERFFRAFRLREQMDLQEHASIYLYDQFLEADRDRRLFEGRLALAEEQRHSQRVMFVSIIIGLVLLLLLSLQALRHTRKLKEAERIRFELESRAQSVELLVETQELRAIKGAIEAADKERERIALDLHDNAGARITQVAFAISKLKEEMTAAYPSAVGMVDDLIRDIESMNREIRSVTHDLRSPTLHQFGLVTTLEGMRDAIVKSGKLRFELDFHGLQERLDFAIENALHMIVKELLNNAIRHGRAQEFTVSVIREEEAVLMIVEDDGLGFDAKDKNLRRGNGLQGIEKRIMALHGTLDIDSQPGRGSIFNITIPTT